MNGWLKLAPSFRRIYWTRWPPRRAFSCTQVSLTQLSRLVAPHESPLIRRAISVSNIPAGASVQQLLDLVHCGPLESAQLIPTESASHGVRAIVSFLDGPSASRFALRSTSLTLAGQALTFAWVSYRPLDPVVATAVARDCARRCLLLCKAGDHTQERDPENDKWAPARLESYLTQVAGPVERLVIRDLKAADSKAEEEEDGARDAGKVQEGECSTEIAEVHFLSIESAIRAHARIRADPLMMRVHVEYGVDRCDGDTCASLSSNISEPRPHHPTYFPPTGPGDLYRPFSTVTLRNLHPQTTLADLCKRIYGGPLYAIALREGGEADVSFFHMEDARDFYAGTMRHGFTVHGRPLAVEPRPEVFVTPYAPPKPSAAESGMRLGDSYPLTELPTPMPLVYSRVIRLRVFGSVGYLPITRDKVVRDFGAFGEIESVWMHRRHPSTIYVSFARADDALRALDQLAVVRPEYLVCGIRFSRDACARGVPETEEAEKERDRRVRVEEDSEKQWAGGKEGARRQEATVGEAKVRAVAVTDLVGKREAKKARLREEERMREERIGIGGFGKIDDEFMESIARRRWRIER